MDVMDSRHVERDLFSKEDEFNLVWVPLLEDVVLLDLKFQILIIKKKTYTIGEV